MLRKLLTGILIAIVSSTLVFAQKPHYESIFNAGDTITYLNVRTAGIDRQLADWRNPNFDDSDWDQGPGGVGFGDQDDGTSILRGYSVYLRKWFNIEATSEIKQLLLLGDYDDGFVAYLNGTEVARANMPADEDFPGYNIRASGSHEAKMYSGGYPEPFIIDSAAMAMNLVNGDNLLAIQVHNESSGSTDLSSNFYLIAEIDSENQVYQQVPDWFEEMNSHYSSTLPLIVIDTYGNTIPDEPKINGWMKVYNKGKNNINSFLDKPNEYDGHIAIEQRGYSSRYMYVDDGKISYSLETQDSLGENNNVKLLGMPRENDWILYGPYSDKTMLKNVMAYWIGNNTGAWAPRTQFVDVILNGKQMGIFAFMEKIKRDNDRVDISKLDEDDIQGDSLTGGYIVKVDRNTGLNNESWDSPYQPSNAIDQTVSWVMVYPRPEVAEPEQFAYIKGYITQFESIMNSPDYLDPIKGYRQMIDIESFVDFFLISEFFRDADSFRSSMYLHKDRDDNDPSLKMGPLWDFNYSMSNYDVCGCYSTSGWAYRFNYYCNERYKINPFWWEKIAEDEFFKAKAISRWNELREKVLKEETIFEFIDSTNQYLETSRIRNFEIWPILSTTLWPNYYVGGSYENEITWLKTWIHERLIWIDENIGQIGSSGSESMEHSNSKVTIFPNPISDLATIKLENTGPGNLSISYFTMSGQLAQSTQQYLGYQGTWLIPIHPNMLDKFKASGNYLCIIRLNKQIIAQQQIIFR